MSKISRRKLITTGIAATGGMTGLGAAAQRYGLLPPDYAGIFGLGETLNYACHRLTSNSLAREFPRDMVSKVPFANWTAPASAEFKRLQAGGFADWRLDVDGMVDRPISFSMAELKSHPSRTQITHLICEEGWSHIAEWTGVPLSHILGMTGILPQARYVAYYSIERRWWDSIDLTDAHHPQTLLAYGLNGGELPVANGGPLRMRLPRQLGYKNVKYITRLTLTDSLKQVGRGVGKSYAWYAGI
jgi:DMSO/TMAO reductase YedYZ molybdopterin-dependent catalytic subunit